MVIRVRGTDDGIPAGGFNTLVELYVLLYTYIDM